MIYTIGDLHGNSCNEMKFLNSKNFPEQKDLTKDDFVIQTGDFGFYWEYPGYHYIENGLKKYKQAGKHYGEEEHYKDALANKNYTFLWIDGNHENFDIVNKLPIKYMYGGRVQYDKRKCGTIYHLMRGEVYIIDGLKVLAIGGASSNDKESRITGKSWWPEEVLNYLEMDKVLQAIEDNPDIDMIVSHTFPQFIIDEFLGDDYYPYSLDPTARFLSEVYSLIKPKYWIGGHLHVNKEIIHENTKFICHYRSKIKRVH